MDVRAQQAEAGRKKVIALGSCHFACRILTLSSIDKLLQWNATITSLNLQLDEFKRKKAAALAARQRASQTASGQSTAVNSSSRAPVSAPGDEQQNAAQATPPAAEFHTSPAIGSHSASTKTQPVLRGNGTDFFEEHTPPSQGFAQSTGSWQQPAVSAVGSTTKASESSAPTKKPQTKSPSPEAESRFEPEKGSASSNT